jgi:hypothetical protein
MTDTETMETVDTGTRRVGTVAARVAAAGSMMTAAKAAASVVMEVAVVSTEAEDSMVVAAEDFTGAVAAADTVAGDCNIEHRTLKFKFDVRCSMFGVHAFLSAIALATAEACSAFAVPSAFESRYQI